LGIIKRQKKRFFTDKNVLPEKGQDVVGFYECDYNRLQVFFKRLLLISFTKKLMQKLVILPITVHRAS